MPEVPIRHETKAGLRVLQLNFIEIRPLYVFYTSCRTFLSDGGNTISVREAHKCRIYSWDILWSDLKMDCQVVTKGCVIQSQYCGLKLLNSTCLYPNQWSK